MNGEALSASVKAYLRQSGYSQKELAAALGLNPKVLSRKLHGTGNAFLTHQELFRLLSELVRWHAITTQDEALHLLAIAQVDSSIGSNDIWEKPPLNALTGKRPDSIPSKGYQHAPVAPQHNLPHPTTRLIGREWAVERLHSLLERTEVRLVTLVGSGGSGKTRLALQVAGEMVGRFAQGVWFVALAGQRDPALVPMSILQALQIQSTPGFSPLQNLITYLKNRQLLLVLDNFEQVGAAASDVDALLAAVPGLNVLVTSRTILHLSGEHKFSVPPLDVPDPNSVLETKQLAQYGAVQLFLERAQAMEPDFTMTTENAAIISQICSKVDGLPLALELAAPRVKVLTPAMLLERLSKARLLMLTGGARNLPDRQQTLRDTITWSYDLLSREEQAWFRRLGIFLGGCSLEAVEALMQVDLLPTSATTSGMHPGFPKLVGEGKVAGSATHTFTPCSALDILERLVDNSLLLRVPAENGQARFSMLETLREYALEQLVERGECERLRDWHACYYLREAEAAEKGLRGSRQLAWLARVGADRDNFRAALEWSLQRAREGTCISVFPFFAAEAAEERIAVAGSRTFCSKAVSSDGLLAIEVCLRLSAALRPYWEWQGHLAEGRYWLGTALEVPLLDGRGETALAARAKGLSDASRLSCLHNDQPRAVELADESIALWQQLDDPSGLATALLHRGWAAHAQGEYEAAKRMYAEGTQCLSSIEDRWLRAQLLFYQGAAAGFTSDFEQMRALYTQSRKLFEQVGDTSAVADVLKDQGGMALLEGKCSEAIAYLLKSIKLCYVMGQKEYMTTGIWHEAGTGSSDGEYPRGETARRRG